VWRSQRPEAMGMVETMADTEDKNMVVMKEAVEAATPAMEAAAVAVATPAMEVAMEVAVMEVETKAVTEVVAMEENTWKFQCPSHTPSRCPIT